MKEFEFTPTIVFTIPDERRREIPCKDMDLDCLPNKEKIIPFGNYVKCYLYDPEKGGCPFLPL